MKKVCIALFVLALLIALTHFETTQSQIVTYPFTMPYKNFVLEVLHYNGSLATYNGIKYINLSMAVGSLPMGIIYDNNRNVVWIALLPEYSNPNNIYGIAKVNVSDYSIAIYRFPWYVDDDYYGPAPWTIAIDSNGELWVTIRSYCVTPNHPPSTIPYLAKLNTNNNTLTIFWIPTYLAGGCDIKFHKGFIWYMTNNGLSQINYTTCTIIESWLIPFYGGFMKEDGGYLWLTSISNNFVTRFNISSKQFDLNLRGFDRPLGIEVDEKYVYVAENSWNVGANGTIAKIDKANPSQISRITTLKITNEGPYGVLKDSSGNLWWTDNSYHVGVLLVNGTMMIWESKPYCYFMVEVPESSIWFICKGSAYVGIVSIPLFSTPIGGGLGGGRKTLY